MVLLSSGACLNMKIASFCFRGAADQCFRFSRDGPDAASGRRSCGKCDFIGCFVIATPTSQPHKAPASPVNKDGHVCEDSGGQTARVTIGIMMLIAVTIALFLVLRKTPESRTPVALVRY